MPTTKFASRDSPQGLPIIPLDRISEKKKKKKKKYARSYVVQVQHAVNAMNPNWDNKVAGCGGVGDGELYAASATRCS